MNIIKLVKNAAGATGPDELLELLSGLGVEVSTKDIEMQSAPAAEALQSFANKAIEEKARFVEMTMKFRQGGQMVAFLILPCTP